MIGGERMKSGSVTSASDRPETVVGRNRLRSTHPGRRRRFLLPLTVALVMVILLWGLDWVARVSAQSLLARNIQAETGTDGTPRVKVNGLLFLPQVIRGRYDSVQIGLVDLTAGQLRVASLSAELRGVHLPFHDVLVGSANDILIDGSVEQALITYPDLNAYLESTGRSVRVEAAADGNVRLTATLELLGQSITASADAEISAADGAVAIRPTRLNTDTDLDASSEALLGRRLTVVVPMDPLPFGQQVTDIKTVDAGILVNAGGTNITIVAGQVPVPAE